MKCALCGHDKKADLNIEGHIHHRSPVTCFDKKACRRRQRRKP